LSTTSPIWSWVACTGAAEYKARRFALAVTACAILVSLATTRVPVPRYGDSSAKDFLTAVPGHRSATSPVSIGPSSTSSPSQGQAEASFDRLAQLEKVLTRLIEAYRDTVGQLVTNMWIQTVLVIVAGVLLIAGKKEHFTINIGLGDLPIPSSTLHILVPLGLLYLWLQYGYLLNSVLDLRVRAVMLVDALEPSFPTAMSTKTVLNDSSYGWIDGWCASSFPPEFQTITYELPFITLAFTMLIYGVAFGTAQACALVLAERAQHRFNYPPRTLRFIVRPLPWFALSFLALTHLMFAYGGRNPNHVQFAIAFVATVLCFLFTRFAQRQEGDEVPAKATAIQPR
jgi:hypothetical protein